MIKISVGIVTSVNSTFYYLQKLDNGSWDSSSSVYQGTSGAVSDRYLADAQSKHSMIKPWSDFWGGQGYALQDKVIEKIPDSYPEVEIFPVVLETSPKIKRAEFLARQRQGEIIVGSLRKEKLTIKYTRGIVVPKEANPNWSTGITSTLSLFQDGDVFMHFGKPVKLVGEPYVRYTYRLVVATTNVHPFDLGWPRHRTNVSPLEINSGLVTGVLAEAESGSYDLLTEIAELPSTVSFLADVVKKASQSVETHNRAMKSLYKQLRTATGKFAEKISRKIASAWLAYRYAIMPLIYSIEDIKETLKGYKRVFAKFRKKETSDLSRPESGFDEVTSASATLRCWIKRAYSPEDLVDQLLGVLKINFFSTAWELVTLSFVVDWFVNIGDVITAFTGNKCYIAQAATFSRKIEGSSTYASVTTPSVRVEVIPDFYERQIIEPRNHIGFQFEFDLSWKRQLDAIALGLGPALKLLKRTK